MKILIVPTSQGQLGVAGKKTGFWFEIFATASDRPTGAVCRAPAVFKHTKGKDGQAIVSGKTVTCFTNTEEEAAVLTDVVLSLVEDMLKTNCGNY